MVNAGAFAKVDPKNVGRGPSGRNIAQVLTYNLDTWKQYIYHLLNEPESSAWAHRTSLLLIVIVAVSVVVFCVGTLPEYIGREPPLIVALEFICIGVFTVEYVLKLWSAPDRIRFLKNFDNIVDLLSVAPYYLEMILSQLNVSIASLALIRVFRLTRVFRLFKLMRFSEGFRIVSLSLSRSLDALSLLVFLVGLAVVFFSSLMFYAEQTESRFDEESRTWYLIGSEDPSPYQSIPATFWWCVVTMTTVGYGDMFPMTTLGKLVATLTMMAGVLIIAFPITIIGSNFARIWAEEKSHAKNRKIQRVIEENPSGPELLTALDAELVELRANMHKLDDLISAAEEFATYLRQTEQTLQHAADGIRVYCHNHDNSVPLPSKADVTIAKEADLQQSEAYQEFTDEVVPEGTDVGAGVLGTSGQEKEKGKEIVEII